MKIKINVTQEDIDNGLRRNNKQCAISKAVQRQFDNISCAVGIDFIYFYKKEEEVLHSNPMGINITLTPSYKIVNDDEISSFVVCFDRGQTVEPFSFTIKVDEDKLAEYVNIEELIKHKDLVEV